MELGYKHFSHTHKLEMHEMPEGVDISCSGCNSSANKTIYACWQCNFFLHEQCFLATRSKTHPSHPLHPVTLVPYPTYLSNSFYCNSCKIIGTGFSYSCSDCDFDLHVQCAYFISDSTTTHQPNLVSSTHPDYTPYPNPEIVPQHFHGQSSSMVPKIGQVSTPFPTPNQAPTVHAQNSINFNHDPYMAQNLSHFSVPYNDQNPTASHQSYVSQNLPNFPPSRQNSSLNPYPTNITHDSYMAQHVSPFTAPNPTTSAQNKYASQNFMNIAISAQSSSIPQYPTNITHDSNMTYNVSEFHVPPIPQNLITTPQKAYASQNYMNVPASAQNPPIPQNITYNLAPSACYEQPSHFGESCQNIAKNKGIVHFSHPHGLILVNIKHVNKKITCSGCQESLVGKGYACVEENCGFQLDESCFNLEKEIWHKSHPAHPLLLLSSSPYRNENGMFACGACYKNGFGFTYHCSICEYDLDIKCANLKETVKRDDHQHILKLCYEGPLNGEDYAFYCDVCNRVVTWDHGAYYCKVCDYGTHLDCVHREECDDSSRDPDSDEQRLNEAILIVKIEALGRKYALELWD